MAGLFTSLVSGVFTWIGELIHDMFFVQDDHPMTQKEYDRWNAGRLLMEIPGNLHRVLREERRHREIIQAIERSKFNDSEWKK
jgi:hypothetical protein